MPCHASSSSPSRRRRPPLPSSPPRQIAARLNLDEPGERNAFELIRRYTTGRWPLWRLLGMYREGPVLYCAVEWLRTGKGSHSEKYALAEVALDHIGVRWHYRASAAAARADLLAKSAASRAV